MYIYDYNIYTCIDRYLALINKNDYLNNFKYQ